MILTFVITMGQWKLYTHTDGQQYHVKQLGISGANYSLNPIQPLGPFEGFGGNSNHNKGGLIMKGDEFKYEVLLKLMKNGCHLVVIHGVWYLIVY